MSWLAEVFDGPTQAGVTVTVRAESLRQAEKHAAAAASLFLQTDPAGLEVRRLSQLANEEGRP